MDNIEKFFNKLRSLFEEHRKLKREVQELSKIVHMLEKQQANRTVYSYLKELQNSYGSNK